LLEVILALGLATVLLAAAAMALRLYLRAFERCQPEVEQAQLARAVLGRIAQDLRSAIPTDAAQLEKLAEKSIKGTDALKQLADESEGAKPAEIITPLNAEGDVSSSVPRTVPGLYGTRYELQVDVSRLPRFDQLAALIVAADEPLPDRISDVKTVAYYLLSASSSEGVVEEPVLSGGLARRELDRATTLWAAQQGTLDGTSVSATVLAPEVSALKFRYFDGDNWFDEWDTEQQGGLPAAVEVVIELTRPGTNRGTTTWWATTGDASSARRSATYRLVVFLPAARPNLVVAAPESEESADQTEGGNQD
jgi:hypothetical protein